MNKLLLTAFQINEIDIRLTDRRLKNNRYKISLFALLNINFEKINAFDTAMRL